MKNKIPEERVTKDNADELHEVLFAPYVKQLDINYLEVEEGRVVARLENAPEYQFVTGAVCGQVLMAAIDTVMSMAMMTSENSQRGTLSQNNNFVRPAIGAYFTIECIVQRFGSSLAIGETKVYAEETDTLICHSTSTYAMKKSKIR